MGHIKCKNLIMKLESLDPETEISGFGMFHTSMGVGLEVLDENGNTVIRILMDDGKEGDG